MLIACIIAFLIVHFTVIASVDDYIIAAVIIGSFVGIISALMTCLICCIHLEYRIITKGKYNQGTIDKKWDEVITNTDPENNSKTYTFHYFSG